MDYRISGFCCRLYHSISGQRFWINEIQVTLRDLAAKNAYWSYYDENFRYLRQTSLFPWDEVHWESWLEAHHMIKLSSSNNPPNSFNQQSKQPFPRGFCWKFRKGERCFGCNFKHACFKCGGNHPATKCKSRKPTATTSCTVASSATTNTSQSKYITFLFRWLSN